MCILCISENNSLNRIVNNSTNTVYGHNFERLISPYESNKIEDKCNRNLDLWGPRIWARVRSHRKTNLKQLDNYPIAKLI